jgi:hypothetical protein
MRTGRSLNRVIAVDDGDATVVLDRSARRRVDPAVLRVPPAVSPPLSGPRWLTRPTDPAGRIEPQSNRDLPDPGSAPHLRPVRRRGARWRTSFEGIGLLVVAIGSLADRASFVSYAALAAVSQRP